MESKAPALSRMFPFLPDGERDGGDAASAVEISRFSGGFMDSRESGIIS